MRALRALYLPLLVAVIVLPLLAGCAGMGVRAPNSPLEMIEAAEITAQQVITSIDNLTCNRSNWDGVRCKELGRPWSPDTGLDRIAQVEKARSALKTAAAIPVGGVSDCLGQPRSQLACIAAAKASILEVERLARGGK